MRGQAGVEFMVSTILVLLIVMVFYVSTFGRLSATPSSMTVEQLCRNIATKINTASQFGDGFAQSITLPSNIKGISYNVTVYDTSVICRSSVQDIVKPHMAESVSNGTSGPPFTLQKKTLLIKNNRGIIVIS